MPTYANVTDTDPAGYPARGDKNGWCVYLQKLDTIFQTMKDSPLHHDNRCEIHTSVKGANHD